MTWAAGAILLLALLAWASPATATEHEGNTGEDELGEGLGTAAGWLLAVAGVTAAWNLVRRRMLPRLRGTTYLKPMMRWHKRLAAPLHGWTGLLSVVVGTVHGLLMESSALLWGTMVVMGWMSIGGALLQWKWAPSEMRRGIYLLHAQQVVFVVTVVLLVVGHELV